jgi:undecaprenyl-diphosphatase
MSTWLSRLDHGDRALYVQWIIGDSPTGATLFLWRSLTHVGGGGVIAFALAPLVLAEGPSREAAVRSMLALMIAQCFVQVIKRTVARTRPSEARGIPAFAALPDRFSFPSGHAASVMSVAFAHAATFRSLAMPLLALAVLVGASRVRLRVHYPGDVLVGQAIGIVSGVAARAFC